MAGWLRQAVAAGLRESTRFRLRQHSPRRATAPETPPGAATLQTSPGGTAPLGPAPLGPGAAGSAPLGAARARTAGCHRRGCPAAEPGAGGRAAGRRGDRCRAAGAGRPGTQPGRAVPGPPPARRGAVALAARRAGLHPGRGPPRDRTGGPGPRQLRLALEGRLGRRGVGAVLRGEPALHPRLPALGDDPVPLHLDQPDLALRLPGLGHRADAVGARPGHGDHVRRDRLGRLPAAASRWTSSTRSR